MLTRKLWRKSAPGGKKHTGCGSFSIGGNDPVRVMGRPDDMKLRSCMTLFRQAAPECPLFQQVLDKYYDGQPDRKTLDMLKGKQA